MKNTLKLLLAVAFAILAVLFAVNHQTVLRYVLAVWYGKHFEWNGMTVELSDGQFVYPRSSTGELLIGDQKEGAGFLTAMAHSPQGLTPAILVSDICRRNACDFRSVNQQSLNGKKVSVAELRYPSEGQQVLQVIVSLDPDSIWIEYKGPESRYPEYKKQMDSLIEQASRK